MLVLMGPGHSTDEVTGLLRARNSRSSDAMSAMTPCLATLYAPIRRAAIMPAMEDVELISGRSEGEIDFTVGSALDIFGGKGVSYDELLTWNAKNP